MNIWDGTTHKIGLTCFMVSDGMNIWDDPNHKIGLTCFMVKEAA